MVVVTGRRINEMELWMKQDGAWQSKVEAKSIKGN